MSGKWLNHHKNGMANKLRPWVMRSWTEVFVDSSCGDVDLTSWCCFVHGSEGWLYSPRSTPFWLWAKRILPKVHFPPLLNGFTNTYQVEISWSQEGHARHVKGLYQWPCALKMLKWLIIFVLENSQSYSGWLVLTLQWVASRRRSFLSVL